MTAGVEALLPSAPERLTLHSEMRGFTVSSRDRIALHLLLRCLPDEVEQVFKDHGFAAQAFDQRGCAGPVEIYGLWGDWVTREDVAWLLTLATDLIDHGSVVWDEYRVGGNRAVAYETTVANRKVTVDENPWLDEEDN